MLVWPRCVSWGLQAFLIFKENWLDLPKSQPLGSSMPSPGFQGIAQGLRSYLSPLTSSYCSIELSVIAHLQSSTVISVNLGDFIDFYSKHLCRAFMYSRLDWNLCAMERICSAEMQTGENRSFSHPAIRNSSLASLFQTTALCHVVQPPSLSRTPPSLCFPVFQAASSQLLSLSSPHFIMQKSWAPELVSLVIKKKGTYWKDIGSSQNHCWMAKETLQKKERSEWNAPIIFSWLARLENPYHEMKRTLWDQRETVILRILYKIPLHEQYIHLTTF